MTVSAGHTLVALVAVTAVWYGALRLFAVDPFLARSPTDVWRYLVDGVEAAAHRERLAAGLGRTLLDAAAGFGFGLTAALLSAFCSELVRAVRQMVLPVAIVLRSVPLVAMTPLLTLIFGRGMVATIIIGGLVVFFPALVTISLGLRSASGRAVDVCRAYGAGNWTIARKVMLPAAVPTIFASARMAVPAALVGAMLAEWFATGDGLGFEMLQDANTFDYDHLWAAVAALTLVSIIFYNVVSLLETVVAVRFAAYPDE